MGKDVFERDRTGLTKNGKKRPWCNGPLILTLIAATTGNNKAGELSTLPRNLRTVISMPILMK